MISRIRERVSSSTLIVSLVRFTVSSPLFASICGWLERSSKELSPLLRYRRAARLSGPLFIQWVLWLSMWLSYCLLQCEFGSECALSCDRQHSAVPASRRVARECLIAILPLFAFWMSKYHPKCQGGGFPVVRLLGFPWGQLVPFSRGHFSRVP